MTDYKRVSFDTELSWELGGESVIYCELTPNSPKFGEEALVRITHGNVYGPIEDVEFFVRVGSSDSPTAFDDLDSATDWVKAELVEEIVTVDDVEMHRSNASEPFGEREEVPWDGTFEARLTFPPGSNSVEIKVLSNGYVQSGVLSDWVVNVS